MPRVVLPDRLVEQARAFAAGDRKPAQPRNAATVLLLRDASKGLSVYLLRRQSTMAFAGGMVVFPGGGVDQRDFDASVAWAGPPVSEWATRLGVGEQLARALVCAAVRETFEESGVLLAGPSAEQVVADTTGDDWEVDRVALENRELAFTEFLTGRGLVLRTDLLGVWSAWLTPVFEPRRYRTWFFVAELPSGQRTRDVSTESDAVAWSPVMGAVEASERGEIGMMPPTYLTCLEVGQHATAAEVLAAAAAGRETEVFMPEPVDEDGVMTLSFPERLRPLVEGRDW
jgi:8-oxo-dGTP pyrophosphatase MutT (NUDIX family)